MIFAMSTGFVSNIAAGGGGGGGGGRPGTDVADDVVGGASAAKESNASVKLNDRSTDSILSTTCTLSAYT